MPNAKRREKLTKTMVEKLQPEEKEFTVWDIEVKSFFVRVLPSGTKSFGVFYRDERGRQHKRSFGRFPDIRVSDAREKASFVRSDIKRGYDQFEEQNKKRGIPSLSDYWTVYLNDHAKPNKAARSVQEDESLWKNRLAPTFGHLSLDEISKASVRRWHKSEPKRFTAANRALMLLSKMMNMAIDDELIERNPCKGIDHFPEKAREYVPTKAELQKFYEAIGADQDRGAATMTELLFYTGGRRGEALNATWKEFDLDKGVWIVPAEHIKNGKRLKQRIRRRLPPAAVELLREWQYESGCSSGYVFPSLTDPNKPRYDIKAFWNRVRKRSGLSEFRTHDIRHTFASLALEQGYSLAQIGAELGHRSPQTTLRYAHRDFTSANSPASGVAEVLGMAIKATDS
ncbi:site-specific integrase [Henriciella barbarensis]|uniref:Site-specific integrase n=1 Tax=Henriciella barbarensis TaxID=86342 RepID=A0A399R2M5_9PROT|nr:site-specific integrase [Henriciella barbarensis]RIJ24465.1 site-specific integrase [Henriciella barbarensis]